MGTGNGRGASGEVWRFGFDRVTLESDAANVIRTVHNKVERDAPIFFYL